MKVATASTNGGSLHRVHAEFSDGYVFAIRQGDDYLPISFTFEDAFECLYDSVIVSGEWYHKHLMRSDGGLATRGSGTMPTFSWSELVKVRLDEARELYGYELNRETDAAICNLIIGGPELYRKDRTYWKIGKTIQNAASGGIEFGFSQPDPRLCEDENCDYPCSEDSWKARTGCEEDNTCYETNLEERL